MPARVRFRALVGSMLAFAVLAPQFGRAQSGDDPVVAMVNGEPIRRAEVMAEVGALPAHYRELPLDQLYPVVLNRIIDGRLLLAEGLKRGLDTDPEVRRRVAG
ncbi:MAG: peptidylprolyl isomerase, partial [Kiloniellales bacterium]